MQDKKPAVITNINLAEYTPTQREEKENRNGKWVDYGYNNDYPDFIIDLYRNSPTHHAVVDKISQMLMGEGIESNVADGAEKLRRLGINKELQRLCFDFELQAGAYLEVIRSKNDEPLQVNHLPYENCRLGIADEDGEIVSVWYSDDWSQYRKDKYEPVEIPIFTPQSKDARSVIFIGRPTPGSLYYPSPSYEGAINYIEAEAQIAIYHNNQLLNGLFPSFIINFRNGQGTDEERRLAVRDIENKISGTKNAGKFIATFNDSPESTPEIEAFPLSDADKQYQFLSEECTNKILRGHRVTNPILFGVREGGGLGNNANEMEESKRMFEDDVIFPDRRCILKGLEPLFNSVGIIPSWGMERQDVESDVERSYTGIQIASAIDIISQVNAGTLNSNQGMTLVQSMLGFDEESAKSLFEKQVDEGVALSDKKKVPTLTEEWGNALADKLEEFAETYEDLESDGWEAIFIEEAGGHEDESKIDLDYILDKANSDTELSLGSVYANPGERSEWGDSGLYKLRYRYSQNLSANSRDFCSRMVSLSKQGYIFRKEDIDSMSSSGVNGQFAPEGSSTYDLFEWKGGVYCHHKWERVIFFRKRNENGQFLPPSPEGAKTERGMKNDKRVANVPFVPQKGEEGVAPIKTPSRGSLKNR